MKKFNKNINLRARELFLITEIEHTDKFETEGVFINGIRYAMNGDELLELESMSVGEREWIYVYLFDNFPYGEEFNDKFDELYEKAEDYIDKEFDKLGEHHPVYETNEMDSKLICICLEDWIVEKGYCQATEEDVVYEEMMRNPAFLEEMGDCDFE